MTGVQSTLATIALISSIIPKFTKDVDEKYTCIVCKQVLVPKVSQLLCGHRICSGCTRTERSNNEICPGGEEECLEAKLTEIFPDVGTDRELSKMEVFCTNQSHGCDQCMKWLELPKHLETCPFEIQPCRNAGAGCKEKVLRKDIDDHIDNKCMFVMELCPICNEMVSKFEFNNSHEEICQNKVRGCKMAGLGCGASGKSGEILEHESDISFHSSIMVRAITDMKAQMSECMERLKGLEKQNVELMQQNEQLHAENTHFKNTITSRLNRIEKSIAANNEKLLNHEKSTNENIQAITQKVSSTYDVLKVHDGQLSNLKPNQGASALPQANINQIEKSIQNYERRFAENEIRFRCLECTSYNGELIWKISNYRQRKQDAIDGRTLSLYSQPFFSGPYGYKMCARIYLNGDGMGKNSHISLFFVLMKGEYDSLQQWPFKHRVSLSILDQQTGRGHLTDVFRPDPTSTSFRQPVGDMNIASGCPLFATQSVVETERYIKNDTLFVKVHVRVEE